MKTPANTTIEVATFRFPGTLLRWTHKIEGPGTEVFYEESGPIPDRNTHMLIKAPQSEMTFKAYVMERINEWTER